MAAVDWAAVSVVWQAAADDATARAAAWTVAAAESGAANAVTCAALATLLLAGHAGTGPTLPGHSVPPASEEAPAPTIAGLAGDLPLPSAPRGRKRAASREPQLPTPPAAPAGGDAEHGGWAADPSYQDWDTGMDFDGDQRSPSAPPGDTGAGDQHIDEERERMWAELRAEVAELRLRRALQAWPAGGRLPPHAAPPGIGHRLEPVEGPATTDA